MAIEERYDPNSDVYRRTTVQEQFSLKGKTTVVTGGGQGLGLAMARGCGELGSNLAIMDIVSQPSEECQKLDELDIKWKYYRVDVRDHEAVKAAWEQVDKEFGKVHGLINCAGIAHRGPFHEFDLKGMENVIDINIVGVLTNSQLAIQRFLAHNEGGSIVNIASISGHIQVPGRINCVYSATKGAVIAFTKSVAAEYATRNVRVNSISPGFFVSPGTAGDDVAKFFGHHERFIPMRRFADRAEIKGLATFLLSPASSYITGEDIAIDGGVLAV